MSGIKSLVRQCASYLCISCFLVLLGCGRAEIQSSLLEMVTGDQWGSVPVADTLASHHLSCITIHHGGVYFDPHEDVHENLRNLQDWSRREKDWIDIPYHYLMDMQGKLYEGRSVKYPGDTNTNYDPAGHLLICVIGNYEEQEFTNDQYESLVAWLHYFCSTYDLPADSIRGHKDFTETLCPGQSIYRILQSGQLIEDVKKILNKS